MDRWKAIEWTKQNAMTMVLQLLQCVYPNSDVRKFGLEIPCGQPTKPTQTAREQQSNFTVVLQEHKVTTSGP